ncbi:radical SAM protein, partial [Candidatus Fermentibacteria bacterium]|nr:radical SAM protein [Candidatus Fermentibacteria bacterium]
MIADITAKSMLSSVRQPDPWFGLRYSMNLYRGCQHQCIYCDSRSACYGIENFSDIVVKTNAIELLRRELPRKRVKGTIGTGSMHDPYMPLEAERRLTRGALEVIAQHRFSVHVITKSDLVLRDTDVLGSIGSVYAAVSFSITTADDSLAAKIEPNAPPPSRRLRAMQTLAGLGVLTGVVMMPLLPFLEDTEANVRAIVTRAHEAGAAYIVPAFGMTLRDRQRDYYYAQLDRLFPGLRKRYERRFGERYSCGAANARRLKECLSNRCADVGLVTRMPVYSPHTAEQ